jgi:hypothetical protein
VDGVAGREDGIGRMIRRDALLGYGLLY